MMVYDSMDFASVYDLPISYRKWLIQRWNKHAKKQNKEDGGSDVNQPLSKEERIKMINRAQQSSNTPQSMQNYLGPQRNK